MVLVGNSLRISQWTLNGRIKEVRNLPTTFIHQKYLPEHFFPRRRHFHLTTNSFILLKGTGRQLQAKGAQQREAKNKPRAESPAIIGYYQNYHSCSINIYSILLVVSLGL